MERSVKKALPRVQLNESNLISYVQVLIDLIDEIRTVLNREVGELVTVSADYSCLESDRVVVATDAITVTLPSSYRVARPITIYNSNGSAITVAPQTGETVEGGATDSIAPATTAVTYFANDGDWILISAV